MFYKLFLLVRVAGLQNGLPYNIQFFKIPDLFALISYVLGTNRFVSILRTSVTFHSIDWNIMHVALT